MSSELERLAAVVTGSGILAEQAASALDTARSSFAAQRRLQQCEWYAAELKRLVAWLHSQRLSEGYFIPGVGCFARGHSMLREARIDLMATLTFLRLHSPHKLRKIMNHDINDFDSRFYYGFQSVDDSRSIPGFRAGCTLSESGKEFYIKHSNFGVAAATAEPFIKRPAAVKSFVELLVSDEIVWKSGEYDDVGESFRSAGLIVTKHPSICDEPNRSRIAHLHLASQRELETFKLTAGDIAQQFIADTLKGSPQWRSDPVKFDPFKRVDPAVFAGSAPAAQLSEWCALNGVSCEHKNIPVNISFVADMHQDLLFFKRQRTEIVRTVPGGQRFRIECFRLSLS